MIEISIQKSELEVEFYAFNVFGLNCDKVGLAEYRLESRDSANSKKWKCEKKYNFMFKYQSNISENEVPITEEVKRLVAEKIIQGLKIGTYGELNK